MLYGATLNSYKPNTYVAIDESVYLHVVEYEYFVCGLGIFVIFSRSEYKDIYLYKAEEIN
jgi:hypothetical protein